jgi:hypothetical protein
LNLWLDLQIILTTLPALWTQCLDMRQPKQKGATLPTAGIAKAVHS